jgi:hypothetical protein
MQRIINLLLVKSGRKNNLMCKFDKTSRVSHYKKNILFVTVIHCKQAHAPEADLLGFVAYPKSKRGAQIKNLYCRSS